MSELPKRPWIVLGHKGSDDKFYSYFIEAKCDGCAAKVTLAKEYFGDDHERGQFILEAFNHIVKCVNSPTSINRVSSIGLTAANRKIEQLNKSVDHLIKEESEAKLQLSKVLKELAEERRNKSVELRRCVKGHLSNHNGPACKCGSNWKDVPELNRKPKTDNKPKTKNED